MLSKCWNIEQGGVELPVVFTTKRDAIAYADQNLAGEYLLVRSHFLEGVTKEARRAKPLV